ncbi:MAG: hypothetical protein MZV70_12965 [Desulfobacterales bacterium]|nr:hypothetical protein [Desulfobacterales bacterium]
MLDAVRRSLPAQPGPAVEAAGGRVGARSRPSPPLHEGHEGRRGQGNGLRDAGISPAQSRSGPWKKCWGFSRPRDIINEIFQKEYTHEEDGLGAFTGHSAFPPSLPSACRTGTGAQPAESRRVLRLRQGQTLVVKITHTSNNPDRHFVKEVVVKKNGQVVQRGEYTKQAGDTFTYTYKMAATGADTIEVTGSLQHPRLDDAEIQPRRVERQDQTAGLPGADRGCGADQGGRIVLLYLHAGFMIAGLTLMTAGVTVARLARKRPRWLRGHRALGPAASLRLSAAS